MNHGSFVNAVGAAMLVVVACMSSAIAEASVTARIVSSRPDMVTGEEVLVELTGVSDPSSVSALLNGHRADRTLRAGTLGGKLAIHVGGLKLGRNRLEFYEGHSILAKLDIVDHPITGPVFSGPQQQPFICQTQAAGLGAPLDASCSARTKVEYLYKSTQPVVNKTGSPAPGELPAGFKFLDMNAPRPADIAKTSTSEGHLVNFIVRRERGTINRAIYEISFLQEPGSPLPDPWSRPPGWNGRLIYRFGGGCSAGYHQGDTHSAATLSTVDDIYLARGYAVVNSSLNVFHNDCNDVISAETAEMVKEHFIDRFGVPVYTIGEGPSGGSIQQYLLVQNYPGILDGIIPRASFPDITTTLFSAVDCLLLDHAFGSGKQRWTDEQKAAVSGFATWNTCKTWNTVAPGWIKATSSGSGSCDGSIPHDLIYDPKRNPRGARCSMYDNAVNSYGRDVKTRFARRPFDNVGVQYGLVAFNAGTITAEQFVDLNELVGGYDRDGNIVGERSIADVAALGVAYGKGRVNTGAGGLGVTPIIDWRSYTDLKGDVHDRVRSLITRARLIAANGSASNQVIITIPAEPDSAATTKPPTYVGPMNAEVIVEMEKWLDALVKDTSKDPASVKVARAKPKELNDTCVTDTGERIVEPASFTSQGRCNKLYPPHTTTRMAAGGPLRDDILKCALKPFDPDDYTHALSGAQIERLRTVFEKGVCDYTHPGVAQGGLSQTWLRY